MIFTNTQNLPLPFLRAVENDGYDNGGSDFTATGLANPPRATALSKLHADTLTVDCHTRAQALIGQAMHKLAERAARPGIDICEKRYFSHIPIDGETYTLSGQIDLLETDSGILYDWKSTKAYAFHRKTGSGKKPEYIAQMNVCLFLLRQNGLDAKELKIIALLKDWDEVKAANDKGYPQCEVVGVTLPIWPTLDTRSYIEQRIRLHLAAKKELPDCSSKDNWGSNRCRRWCDVNKVCTQYMKAIETGII